MSINIKKKQNIIISNRLIISTDQKHQQRCKIGNLEVAAYIGSADSVKTSLATTFGKWVKIGVTEQGKPVFISIGSIAKQSGLTASEIKEAIQTGGESELEHRISAKQTKLLAANVNANQAEPWNVNFENEVDREINNFFNTLQANTPDKKSLKEKDLLKEIYFGAYVLVPDKDLYNLWKTSGAHPRISSHASNDPQYAIRTKAHKELLFGTIEKPTKDGKVETFTWFQLERTPSGADNLIQGTINFAEHMVDYVNYKRSGKNQGPHGASIYTEKNPLTAL